MGDAGEDQKPHVAFLSGPGMGHIIPLLEFAKRLAVHQRFRVSFLVFTTEASGAQNQILRSPSLPLDLKVVDIPPVDVSSLVTPDMPVLSHLCTIVHESLHQIRSLILGLDGKPKALIIDIFCTEAIDISEELSIPTYLFFTSSAWLLGFALYLPTLDREVDGEFVDLPQPVDVPGCIALRTEDLLDQVRDRKIDEYKWFLFHCSRYRLTAGILVNTWEEFEPVSIQALHKNQFFRDIPTPPIHIVGPLIREKEMIETESDKKIFSWLDNQPESSVVFVSLGSGGTLSTEQLRELALGLELSKQRFLMVIRKPSDAIRFGAYFSVGRDENDPSTYLPEGFLERTERVGLVVPTWAPQVEVLSHPATGAYLCHCGWNSTMEAVITGVPMITWPLFAEQRMNATVITEQAGVGVRPEERKKVIGREEVERAVRKVMEGEEGKVMRERICELGESGRKALDSGGSSSESIRRLAKLWES